MLMSSSVSAELTRETINRLQDGGSYTAYQQMKGSPAGDLKLGLKDLRSEGRHLIGDPDPKIMELARGLLIFSCDPRTNTLYTIPWIRSPRTSQYASHGDIGVEFGATAQLRYPNLDINAVYIQPDAVSGIIARVPDQAPIFFGIGGAVPDAHTASIEQAQSDLAEAGLLLHVQLGRTLLLATNTPENSVSAQIV